MRLRKDYLEKLTKLSKTSALSTPQIMSELGISNSQARIYKAIIENADILLEDQDILIQNIKLAK